MAEIITLENISKQYNGHTVLAQIHHTIHKGQALAFMGHNGCGKSTLLKIIAKLVAPTSGKVIYQDKLLFHYIPEKFPPTPLSARAYLLHMGAIGGMGKDEAKRSVEKLGSDFFLEELLDSPMQVLSKGTLQKVGVIQALMEKPDVLLLDEPLSGQDAASQKVFIEKVNRLRNEGVTVLMACHEKRLVRAIAEKVYTIKDGNLAEYEPEESRIYSVILEKDGDLRMVEGMVKYGRYYKLQMEETVCDAMLPELLAAGWRMRGMEYEEDDRAFQLSDQNIL